MAGGQTRYGDNNTVDDIVAHEWTHAVTEFSAGLLYIAGVPQGIEKVMLKSSAAGRAKVLVRGR